ncbi:MAG: hypothetical protein AAFQ42_04135 [Pseudomonadota bacterium]
MKRIALAILAAASVSVASLPAVAQGYSDAQCQADVLKADTDGDGFIDANEGVKYTNIMGDMDSDRDGKISRSEAVAACKKSDLRDALYQTTQ